MTKRMKGLLAAILSMGLVLGSVTASAAPAKTVKNPTKVTTETTKKVKPVAQKVAKVTCTASGKVNISFKGKVKYTDGLKAVIKDADGKEIACKITKKNKALLTVSATGLVKGQKYTIIIEGVQAKNAEVAATIEKTFTAKGMKTACKAAKATVSHKKFVILKTNGAAYYKDATVIVKDANGKELPAKIVKKAKGNIKVQITGLKKGQTYTVTVNGVKTKKEKNYSSISKTFKVK